jgi:hypothetical protein
VEGLCSSALPRHRFVFKVNKMMGFESEIFMCGSCSQIPLHDLLAHLDGTPTP